MRQNVDGCRSELQRVNWNTVTGKRRKCQKSTIQTPDKQMFLSIDGKFVQMLQHNVRTELRTSASAHFGLKTPLRPLLWPDVCARC